MVFQLSIIIIIPIILGIVTVSPFDEPVTEEQEEIEPGTTERLVGPDHELHAAQHTCLARR